MAGLTEISKVNKIAIGEFFYVVKAWILHMPNSMENFHVLSEANLQRMKNLEPLRSSVPLKADDRIVHLLGNIAHFNKLVNEPRVTSRLYTYDHAQRDNKAKFIIQVTAAIAEHHLKKIAPSHTTVAHSTHKEPNISGLLALINEAARTLESYVRAAVSLRRHAFSGAGV